MNASNNKETIKYTLSFEIVSGEIKKGKCIVILTRKQLEKLTIKVITILAKNYKHSRS